MNDTNTYQKLDQDPTDLYKARVEEKVQTMLEGKEISKKVGRTLLNKKVRTPQIYFLPKIHKNPTAPPPADRLSLQTAALQKEFLHL